MSSRRIIRDGCVKPARQLFPQPPRLPGQPKKIFNVHFRNIRGHFLDFQETFPDNGSVDMLRAIRTDKEVGYEGMIMPGHAPTIEGDSGRKQAFAFEYGCIAAALQTVQNKS